ncbi:substrate-binding and VWA domain-containing protein [Streptomyces sp. NPDC050738]|uniref:substrate-binding and VWA domain-containing protein n=1 Tax=Streptomyces sp. NPDC050738 TaxID=3154744 RepID=UPI0034246A0C
MLVLCVATGTALAAQGGLLGFSTSCSDSAVKLRLVASPDIAPAIREVADRVREDKITTDGECMDITVTSRDSYKVADALSTTSAKPGFEIWLPDSQLWVQRAEATGKSVPLSPSGSVAASPVTLAMVPSAAKALGWPRKTYTWAELAGAAMQSDKIHLGAADPARSASGLLALNSISRSAGNGPESATQVAASAKVLSQRISDGDTQVLETLARDDSGAEKGNPRRNQALVLSEQAAFAHNTSSADAQHLDLFYAKDGTPQLDYPYTLVNEGAHSTDQSRAALRFMSLLGEDSARGVIAQHGFRTPDQPARDSDVKTAGGLAPQPYGKEPPQALTDQELEETLGMWTITVQSARLTTVVDASGSMATLVPGRGSQTRMDVTKASLLQALAQFTPEDEIGLWDFATRLDGSLDYRKRMETVRLGDPAKGGGTQRDRLSASISGLAPVPDGATGLYDTTLAAVKDAQATYVSGKFNAVVVLTDGVNEDDHGISRSGLITKLKQLTDIHRPVPLIMIAVGPDTDKTEVEQVAEATGGAGYQVSDPADIHAVLLKAVIAAASAKAS